MVIEMGKFMKKEPEYIEYEDGRKVLLSDDDAPELTEEFFKKAKRVGRPISSHSKRRVKLQLDSDVVAILRKSGKGWQTRINDILREWLEKHPAG
jgi:uncharacterized protein (DUF4415 family)